MQPSSITKYVFHIHTRNGVEVDNLSIFGRDESEARRKLEQIYNDCEIIECRVLQSSLNVRGGHLNYEDVVDLIIAS